LMEMAMDLAVVVAMLRLLLTETVAQEKSA
jgi:hypothetical protein